MTSRGYPHYPHSRKPRTGQAVVVAIVVAVVLFCCCSVGLFAAFRPAAFASIVKANVHNWR